ncbi:DapH/DapD/GlmU-related protein [Companilactobacillus metriopterae]|uniref:DapH/DapD/GlmU-related protein n=1 Tax=Companilactobacillus metriopterae TaxID=1909267 RepID=UPI00100BDD3A|nr:DapH/DapD/GlmU-related protein [Companilactobacillus metriopterae]
MSEYKKIPYMSHTDEHLLSVVKRNTPKIFEMNHSFHTDNEMRTIFGDIIGQHIDQSVTINQPINTDYGNNITLGKNIFINRDVFLVDLGGITIEDDVLIGPRVTLITVNHLEEPTKRRDLSLDPITIKKGAWIGANATILPGVTVGKNSIVAASATVTKDVPDNTIVGGIPAKVIRHIH